MHSLPHTINPNHVSCAARHFRSKFTPGESLPHVQAAILLYGNHPIAKRMCSGVRLNWVSSRNTHVQRVISALGSHPVNPSRAWKLQHFTETIQSPNVLFQTSGEIGYPVEIHSKPSTVSPKTGRKMRLIEAGHGAGRCPPVFLRILKYTP